MDYRETFVNRALDILKSQKGGLPPEVRNIVKELDAQKDAHSLSTEEFNLLQDAAERIDTQIRINKVQKTIRRSSASKVVSENREQFMPRGMRSSFR